MYRSTFNWRNGGEFYHIVSCIYVQIMFCVFENYVLSLFLGTSKITYFNCGVTGTLIFSHSRPMTILNRKLSFTISRFFVNNTLRFYQCEQNIYFRHNIQSGSVVYSGSYPPSPLTQRGWQCAGLLSWSLISIQCWRLECVKLNIQHSRHLLVA
jgi:hypothetical protein